MPIQTIDRGTAGDTTDKFKVGQAFDTCQANDNYLDGNKVGTAATFAALATTPATIGQVINIPCHTSGVNGGDNFKGVSSSGLTVDPGNISASATAGVYWQRVNSIYTAKIEDFGGVADGVTNNDAAFIAARNSLRRDPQLVQQNSGGSSPIITAYASGTIEFGRGVYVISKNVMHITQDMGLIIQGQGSRGNNLSIRGATVLLCKGAAAPTDFFISHYGNGGRSLRLRDLDICYEDNTFTGCMLDTFDSPGFKMESCYVGTNALTAGTRLATATAILRATYEEFLNIKNCVFSGAQYAYYPDYTRTVDASDFGGFGVLFDTTTFYDFVVDHVRIDATRSKSGLKFLNCSFNPINVGSNRILNVSNVSNLVVDTCQFVPSTGLGAVLVEWVLLDNTTGLINGCEFGNFTRAGTIQNTSVVTLTANQCAGSDGWILKGGVINGSGNRFRTVASGYTISTTDTLVVDLGPDDFKNTAVRSYHLPTDSVNVSGVIRYSPTTDASTNKFEINSPRVRVKGVSGRVLPSTAATLAISKVDTGDTIVASAAANQIFNLPNPVFCTEFTLGKSSTSAFSLTINAPAAKTFICGAAGTRVTATISNPGGALHFKAIDADTYMVASEVGTWTYT